MKKLSVIIPCYNTEEFVHKCVKSVIDNNIKNIEIILVNDGSTDDTLKELKLIKEKYKDIKIINKKNGGLSSARNAGIKEARGEYIVFLDSDDTVDKNMYKELINKADEGFDMVVTGAKMIYSDNSTQLVSPGINHDLNNKLAIKAYYPYLYPSACTKIYKTKLLKNFLFKEGIYYEDVEHLYRILPYIKNIGYLNGYYYNYIQRSSSITYSFNKKVYDIINNMDSIVKFYEDNNFLNEYYSEIEYVYVRYCFATFIRRLAKMKNKKEYKIGVNEVIKRVNENFPNYKNNKYLNETKKGFYLKHFNKIFAKLVYIVDKNKAN